MKHRYLKAAEVLDVIDEFLSGNPDENGEYIGFEERQMVWDVISAMRGPDNDNHGIKVVVTSPLRSMALPKSYKAQSGVGEAYLLGSIMRHPRDLDMNIMRFGHDGVPFHYIMHARKAHSALAWILRERETVARIEPPETPDFAPNVVLDDGL